MSSRERSTSGGTRAWKTARHALEVANGNQAGTLQKLVIDVPLATIKAQASTVAFNIGAALPANAKVIASEIDVIAALAGTGPMTACTAQVQNTGETAGSLLGGGPGLDVFTAPGFVAGADEGNAYQTRGGQQLQMTLTSTGGTLANATAGHLAVDLYYCLLP